MKLRMSESLRENICNLRLRWNISKGNTIVLILVMDEVTIDFNVLGSFVIVKIGSDSNGGLTITI